MAESKTVKVKRLGDLTKILAGPEEDKELFTPTRGASGDTPAYEENYDIGQSDNKSGRGMGWYVVHTYSGYEKKVKLNIEKAIENRHIEDKILEVRVPMQDVIETKATGKKTVQKKVVPGYVLIHMDADDNDAWYVVRNTRGVTGFVGPGSKPVPLDEDEVTRLEFEQAVTCDFEVGEQVVAIDEKWNGAVGVISRIDENKQTVTINVEMFGRETPVELSFLDVKKMD